jgi:signal transduction histidine kinase
MVTVTEQLDTIERNYRFLAIDDELDVLQYYKEIFRPAPAVTDQLLKSLADVVGGTDVEPESEASKYQLTVASSGEKGVELAQQALNEQQPFTVAFIDMRMPAGMDGLETVKHLRILDPRIMLVIVTAYSDYSLEQIQSHLLYDVLYLNKPLASEEVIQTVRMLNQSWKEREQNKVLRMQMVSHAKMASLGNMAVRIGHEINQPLSYINGMLQLQKMELKAGGEIDKEEWSEEVDLALEQTVRIKEIIDSLRVFAHPEKSKRYALSLSEAVDHVQRLFLGQLEKRKIQLEINLQEDLPSLHANPSQVQRILTNLMSNAIDALTEPDSATVDPVIHLAANHDTLRNEVRVIFEDNGAGIPESLKFMVCLANMEQR